MTKAALPWILPLALATALACSDESPGTDKDKGNAQGDDDDDNDDDDDDDEEDDDDDATGSKDAGGGKVDAGGAKIDAGGKTDAGGTKADAGAPKGDGGTGGGADSGAKSDAGTTAPSGDKPLPKCVKKDSQVIIVGDSYINWLSHSFPDDLQELSGQSWRMEAVGGSSIASGGITGFIPDQFRASIASDPDAHTVLMDGGGNDILLADPALDPLGECTNTGASKVMACQNIVQMALDAAKALMDEAKEKGIRDVVYFFYPHVPANTILSGNNPDDILDYALPKAKEVCDGAEARTGGELRCTFIDMVPVFEGKDYFNEDIHPNQQGGKAMAEKVWDVMTENCLGQKGPKDCCES